MKFTEPKIYSADEDVNERLEQVGLTASIVVNVARAAAAARADALAVDPSSAPGLFSYIYGVRAIRLNLLKEGWRISRQGNVESTVNDDLGIQLFFQNVDNACSEVTVPRAISGKGSGSRDLVAAGQGDLFGTPLRRVSNSLGSVPTVWLVCVSVDGFAVKAEVSQPHAFTGDQFEDFKERIFVLNEKFEPNVLSIVEDDSLDDFDVQISKK